MQHALASHQPWCMGRKGGSYGRGCPACLRASHRALGAQGWIKARSDCTSAVLCNQGSLGAPCKGVGGLEAEDEAQRMKHHWTRKFPAISRQGGSTHLLGQQELC